MRKLIAVKKAEALEGFPLLADQKLRSVEPAHTLELCGGPEGFTADQLRFMVDCDSVESYVLEMDTAACGRCEGFGHLPGSHETCPDCGGHGSVEVRSASADMTGGGQTQRFWVWYNNGSGYFEPDPSAWPIEAESAQAALAATTAGWGNPPVRVAIAEEGHLKGVNPNECFENWCQHQGHPAGYECWEPWCPLHQYCSTNEPSAGVE